MNDETAARLASEKYPDKTGLSAMEHDSKRVPYYSHQDYNWEQSRKREGFIQGYTHDRWVSVKERIPENLNDLCNDRVFFTCGQIIRIGCYDLESGFWHEDGGGNYLDICSNRAAEIIGGHITHWMLVSDFPLPPKPQGE